jgi:hypothetical protein
VVIDETTSVAVGILCRVSSDAGSVVGGGTLNSCPVLTAVVVSPLSVPTGQVITLGAQATDADAQDTQAFHWTGTGGVVANPTSAHTTFLCSGAGPQTVTVTVSDGTCGDTASARITCVPPQCGNGILEPGEQCDPPGGITCDVSCQRLSICGNGVVERTEECDPPNGVTCSAACQRFIPVATGDGGAAPQGDGAR